jgi:hypothetical protein
MAIVENVRRCAWGDQGRLSGDVMWPLADRGDGNTHCLLSPRTGSKPDELLSAGERWRVTEEALIGPEGTTAPRVAGHVAYWFAWDGYLGARSELWQQ